MRTILHLSDLHFGRLDAAILQPVREKWRFRFGADLTVISGDLNSAGEEREDGSSGEAARFIESLAAAGGSKLAVARES